jgi:hypothetical protein
VQALVPADHHDTSGSMLKILPHATCLDLSQIHCYGRQPQPPGLQQIREGFFRYVVRSRVAEEAVGWLMIGETRSPHDAQLAAIMEWIGDGEPLEPASEILDQT